MFVPKRLEIEGRPELNVFPLNVLFGCQTTWNGGPALAAALYEPDLESYTASEDKTASMEYRNRYGGNGKLVITYDPGKTCSYSGQKFVNGRSCGMAFGSDWGNFFSHFTALGLAMGESCEFKRIQEGPENSEPAAAARPV